MSGRALEVNLKIVKFCIGHTFAVVVQVLARIGMFRDSGPEQMQDRIGEAKQNAEMLRVAQNDRVAQDDAAKILKCNPHSELGREGNANGRAGAEEVSQGALGYLQLLQAGDGCGLGAACVRTNAGDIGDPGNWIWRHLGSRNRKLNNVHGKIRTGIVPVEEIEEFRERDHRPAVVEVERPADAQVRLDVGRTAELVEAGVRSVDINAAGVVRIRDGDGAGALDLGDGAQFESAGNAYRAG